MKPQTPHVLTSVSSLRFLRDVAGDIRAILLPQRRSLCKQHDSTAVMVGLECYHPQCHEWRAVSIPQVKW